MASIFLDNVAELARAHRASSARTTHCCYIRQLSQSRHLDLSLCGQKWVCFTASPCPNPFTVTVSTNFPPELPLFQSFFHSQRLEAWRSASHQLHFAVSYRSIIYRARANIHRGRVAVRVGGRLSPGTSVLSKASPPWYAQNPLQGCQRFTGSHRTGMLVKTELKRGGVKNFTQVQSPISPSTVLVPKSPDSWLLPQETLAFAAKKQSNNISEVREEKLLFKPVKKHKLLFIILRCRDP